MRHWSALHAGTVAALLIAAPLAAAMGDRGVVFVPWRVLDHADAPSSAIMILFWIAAEPEELKHSDLAHSRALMSYAARCVGMDVVRADDKARLERLGATELPLAVLAEADGSVIGRVGAGAQPLRASDVENLVRSAFDAREAAARSQLDDARKKVEAGDRDGALRIYERVASQRCAFPRLAKEAERALRKIRR
jgi:hypothetical protein